MDDFFESLEAWVSWNEYLNTTIHNCAYKRHSRPDFLEGLIAEYMLMSVQPLFRVLSVPLEDTESELFHCIKMVVTEFAKLPRTRRNMQSAYCQLQNIIIQGWLGECLQPCHRTFFLKMALTLTFQTDTYVVSFFLAGLYNRYYIALERSLDNLF